MRVADRTDGFEEKSKKTAYFSAEKTKAFHYLKKMTKLRPRIAAVAPAVNQQVAMMMAP